MASASSSPTSEEDLFQRRENKPLLQWILENALTSELTEVICVISNLAQVRREIRLIDARLFWYADSAAHQNTSAAIIAGLWASHPRSQGVMFLAGNQPSIRNELINSMIDRFKRSSASILAATFADRPRRPILVRRDLFPELLALRNNDTEHTLLESHKQQTELIEWHDAVAAANGQDGLRHRI